MFNRSTILCTILRFGILCYTYFIVYQIILPSIFKNWPHSKYFTADGNDNEIVRQMIGKNDERIELAKEFLRRNVSRASEFSAGKELDLVIVVITVNRESKDTGKLQFLTQTVAHLMMLVANDTSKLFEKKHVIICNVDERGDEFSEAASLSSIVQVVSRFKTPGAIEDHENFDVFEKEKIDYIFCLQQAKMYDSHFVLMMEDDVILRLSSLETVNHLINLRLDHADHNRVKSEAWLFVKLYYPEKWQGYGNEMDKIGELVGIALLGGTLFVIIGFVLFWLIVRLRGSARTNFIPLFWLGAFTSALTVFLIGRQYVQAWRHSSPYTHRLIPAPGCCTQAIIYPSSIVDDLAQHLSRVHCTVDFSIDLAIDDFARKRDLKRYLVEPNVCQHIGFVSSVRHNAKSAAEFLS